jgi:hypothetical protein
MIKMMATIGKHSAPGGCLVTTIALAAMASAAVLTARKASR